MTSRAVATPVDVCAPRPRCGGLTLLELTVVLVIVSLALAVLVPSLTAGRGVQVEQTGRVVAAVLRRARSAAIASSRERAVLFDVRDRRYSLVEGPSRLFPTDVTLRLLTAREELVDGGRGYIRFFPDGSSTGGRLTLSVGTHASVVDVDWLTGAVTVGAARGKGR